jgi:hypothetical protein
VIDDAIPILGYGLFIVAVYTEKLAFVKLFKDGFPFLVKMTT